jgi:hypothetical protein
MKIYYVVAETEEDIIPEDLFASSDYIVAKKELYSINEYNKFVVDTEDYDSVISAKIFKVSIESIPDETLSHSPKS